VPEKPNEQVISLVNRTFANNDCFTFLQTVLNRASTSRSSNPVLRGGDIRAIFQNFLNQTKGGISRNLQGSRYGNASGRIRLDGKGDATIYRGFGHGIQDEYDASGIVAELPHLAGSKGGYPRPEYHDLDLARAAYETGYDKYFRFKTVPNPFSTFPDRKSQEKNRGSMVWSSYFHDIMNQLCPIPRIEL
jgi:hypothetical protein